MQQTQRLLDSISTYLFSKYICRMMALIAAVPMLLVSNLAFAEANPTCPSDHAMYYLGSKSTTPAPKATLSWSAAGNASTTYSFDSGLKLVLSFSDINFVRTGYPEVSSFSGVTTNALNIRHSSEKIDINHRLTATINKPVSKYGFVVQDLDANLSGKYTESVSLVTAGGAFSNYTTSGTTTNFTLSNSSKTITANQWTNCNPTSPCNFNIEWGAQSANTPFVTTHGNTYTGASTTASTGDHVVGYSDFYFCLAPPKLTVKKQLEGTRFNDSDTKRDQFNIKVAGGKLTPDTQGSTASFTTTGTGSTITNGSTVTPLELAPSTIYTISESIINGNASNYSTSYTCTNATTGSTTVMPTGTAGSFTLSNLNYGDEITCTITNSPNYVFSGTVFNDNGGITDAQADATNSTITSGVYNNSNYFNGILNAPSETGISGSTITLVDKCENPTKTYATQTLTSTNASDIGTYQFNIASSVIGTQSSVCLIETYSGSAYPVRTTIDKRSISLITNTYSYSNNNFGRVITKNSAIVLEKEQAANTCTITDLTKVTTYSKNALSSSTNGADVQPGQCIAYRITATNRANMDISNFIMQDVLQKNDASNPADTTVTSVLADPTRASGIYSDGLVKGQNGTITTIATVLTKRSIRSFYFNTQYGSTQSK